MKKLLAVLISIVMVFSLATSVSALDGVGDALGGIVGDLDPSMITELFGDFSLDGIIDTIKGLIGGGGGDDPAPELPTDPEPGTGDEEPGTGDDEPGTGDEENPNTGVISAAAVTFVLASMAAVAAKKKED